MPLPLVAAREVDQLRQLDRFAPLRQAIAVGAEREAWYAGMPMPLDGEQLVVHPSYPFAHVFAPPSTEPDPDAGVRLRNRFHSAYRGGWIVIMDIDGRIDWGLIPAVHHLGHDLTTLGCSDAWGIEQEAAALGLLATLLPHHAFKRYLLTGSFLESSRRSGVTYLFRKLRPTVAIVAREGEGEAHILCALCLHPIAYYSRSGAGAMCPTDDVVAHLMLMRGDERLFWSRANQHQAWTPEAML